LFALSFGLSQCAGAEVTGAISGYDRPLIVATKEAPPFAVKLPDGDWYGLSIELWEQLAAELGLDFDYVELTLPEMLDRVENGTVDIGLSALTITADRESRMDFSYPYYEGGLGIAVTANRESLIWGVLTRLLSWQFLSVVAALAGVLSIAAFFVWIFERRANPDQFGGSRLQGLGAGFWWSAVTMTTVGYGDKAPRSLGGRLIALIWMFAGIIIISSFTAGIASSLTASQVAVDQLRTKSLDSLSIATVERSTGEEFSRSTGLRYQTYPDVESALEAVHKNKAQAVIYDLPLLRHHLMKHSEWEVEILNRILVRESYGIALPPDSALREPLNRTLLEALRTPEWQALRLQYLGGQ